MDLPEPTVFTLCSYLPAASLMSLFSTCRSLHSRQSELVSTLSGSFADEPRLCSQLSRLPHLRRLAFEGRDYECSWVCLYYG